ncbi:TonB-dependent receptor domain-containing protein [Trinickia fusca]|uniref:TonB-dependent receptor n=1 Tax=Trinickia fusca TaxID=2419777 RepID=A0A494XCX3_9BURK|nr:TonB-dependent receptor [Trinickia fusca]RKP48348.1 TonB-dependent receptor [Trinickia fusca]
MRQKALGSAIRKIVWAEMALTAVLGTSAFAQSQPAATGNTNSSAAATAQSNETQTAAAPAAAAGTATKAAAKGDNVQQLKRFEVTGSLIRSADKVGFNQVQTFKAKDIEEAGYTNVSDFLRGASANSASSWSESTQNNFSAGGAGLALRGLSMKYTLVMVDGQRVAPYAFASNGTDTFFDLNSLPLNIIDRIEIVKTGAVSQYGSDAIAGVVNIITKRNVQGLTLDASYGGATNNGGGLGTTKFSAVGGFGDLNADRFNVTAAASYFRENGVTLGDRDLTENESYLGKPGGLSAQPVSYWRVPGSTTGAVQALNGCPYGGSVKPASSNSATSARDGTICAFNGADNTSIVPSSERLSAKVHADFKLTDEMQAFADLWESRNTTNINGYQAGFGGSTLGYNPATGGVNVISNVIPASNPSNPFGVPAKLVYHFPEVQTTKTVSNFWRAAGGVKGSFHTPNGSDWDWSAAYGHSQSTVDNTQGNVLNVPALQSLIGGGTFNFNNPAPGSTNGLFTTADYEGISKLDTVDVNLSTPNLFHLPTGDVGLGLGAQFEHQSEFIGPATTFIQGLGAPAIIQSVNASRNVAAAFYQIDIPIIRHLTFSHSGRYDHYSDFGGAYSPRFALRYQPVQALTVYGSYNRGFRAPTMIENAHSQTFGAQYAQDNFAGSPQAGQSGFWEVVQAGNQNLQPERTKNYNIGFQLSPTRTTDIGIDWYKIHIDNVIGQDDVQTLINANDPNIVHRNSDGSIAFVDAPYKNLAFLDTDGFEGTFRQALPTSIGTFTLSGDWAYVWHFKMPQGGVTSDFAGNNGAINQPFGASFPRWKGNTELAWNYHKWNAALTWQYTGPYAQTQAVPVGAADHVSSYSQFNIYMSYTGFKHWTIYGGVNNIFNRPPPFDPVNQNANNPQGYDTSLYSYYGRFAQVGATYKF